MALSLTYDPQLSRVRVVADGLGGLAMMRAERSTDEVRWTTVRGGESIPVGGELRVDDYEFAPDVQNHYRVVGSTAWDEFSRPPLNANPFFETSAAPWTPMGCTVARSTAQAHEGVASLLVTPDGTTTTIEARAESVPTTVGTTYRASAWVRSAVARSVGVGIIWRDSGGVLLSAASTQVSVPANTWTLITHDATAPAGAVLGQMIAANMAGTPLVSHTVHVDEATLRPFGFGTAPSGQVWQHFGSASAFVAANGVGQHIHTTTNSGRISVVDVGSTRARVRVTGSVPVVALGAGTALTIYAIARFTDDNNFYQARLGFIPDLNITCSIRKRVAGVDTTLASIVLPGVTHVPGTRYVVELDASGSQLLGRAWRDGDPEPDWQVSATDTALTTGTKVGVRTIIDAGSGNTMPLTYTIDDVLVTVPFRTFYSGSITPTLDRVWLKSIARPFLNRQVTVVDYSDVERPSRAGVFDVVGRSFPVAVTDVRGSRRWTIEVLTGTAGDAEDVDLLLASGDVLFVQPPAGTGVPAGYVVVGDTRQRRTSRLGARRVFELPCTEVAAPAADVVGATATCQTVLNAYPTCADVLAAHATCLSLMELIGDPSEVIVA